MASRARLLLSSPGKILGSIIRKRLSHATKAYELLPANHFEAGKQRSVEQALVLPQEHIHHVRRANPVFSLVCLNVNRAHNGVCKEELYPWHQTAWSQASILIRGTAVSRIANRIMSLAKLMPSISNVAPDDSKGTTLSYRVR